MSESGIILNTSSNRKKSSRITYLKPSRKVWFIIIAVSMILHVGWLNLVFAIGLYQLEAFEIILTLLLFYLISAISIIISIFLWKRIGKYLARKIILKTVIKHKKTSEERLNIGNNNSTEPDKKRKSRKKDKNSKFKSPKKLLSLILNINVEEGTLYYLEEKGYEINLSNLWFFLRYKMLDVITTSFVVALLLAIIAKLVIFDFITGMIVVSVIILSTPILSSWILPAIWILKDLRLKYLTKSMDNFDLYEKIRRSLLSRFLSISGLLAAFGFFYEVMPLTTGLYIIFEPLGFAGTILSILLALGGMLFVVFLITGTSSIIVMFYFSHHHESIVNELREELSESIPYGITNVIYPKSNIL